MHAKLKRSGGSHNLDPRVADGLLTPAGNQLRKAFGLGANSACNSKQNC
jgi:hypothetical protein